jgi:ribosomal protein S18 acetylase RimI-like enzyme
VTVTVVRARGHVGLGDDLPLAGGESEHGSPQSESVARFRHDPAQDTAPAWREAPRGGVGIGGMDVEYWMGHALKETEVVKRTEAPEVQTAGYLFRDDRTGIAVREATLSDAPALAAIGARAFQHAHGGGLNRWDLATDVTERFDLARLTTELADRENRMLVALWEGNEIGFAQLRPGRASSGYPGARPLELYGIYVAPDWMGHGVGSHLVRGAFALGRELFFETLWVSVWKGNASARSFLEGWGFRYAGERSIEVGRLQAEVSVLVRPLGG